MPTPHRTDWFHRARWGAASHFLVEPALSVDDWNRRVDAFDVDGLARVLADAGAGYYWLTIGQNSGHYCSPNATYDEFVGLSPSKCSRRDLIADLQAALAPHGIPLMVYLPSGAPAADPVAMARLEWAWGFDGGWPDAWGTQRTGDRLANYQQMWEAVIREWSLRWGEGVSGWWFDGCYFADEMYRHPEAPNFASFAAAARAGNPESILAFNPGVMLQTMGIEEDFIAGEINDPSEVECTGRWLEAPDGHREQWHMWSFLGKWWMQGPLRFTDEQAVEYTRRQTVQGGVATWDVPLMETGVPAPETARQLVAIGAGVTER
jgi:hypothetical protein